MMDANAAYLLALNVPEPAAPASGGPMETREFSRDQSDILAYLWRTPLGQASRRQEADETMRAAFRGLSLPEPVRTVLNEHVEGAIEGMRREGFHAREEIQLLALDRRIAELEAENAALRAAAGYSTDNSPALGGKSE